jgi:hypothetical protein
MRRWQWQREWQAVKEREEEGSEEVKSCCPTKILIITFDYSQFII